MEKAIEDRDLVIKGLENRLVRSEEEKRDTINQLGEEYS